MAYTYRYQIRPIEKRTLTCLREKNLDVENFLNEYYQDNLKEVNVADKYIEFKLYKSVNRNVLQNMGKYLKAIFDLRDQYGFVRMSNVYYAIIYPRDDNAIECVSNIEFVDSLIIEEPELFKERAKRYFASTSLNIKKSEGSIDSSEHPSDEVINFYNDVLVGDVDCNEQSMLSASSSKVSCFRVTCYHRRYGMDYADRVHETPYNKRLIVKFESESDYAYLTNSDENHSKTDNFDYLEIVKSDAVSEGTLKRVMSSISLHIDSATEIEALNRIESGDDMEFRVHNVGQALATSLSYKNADPFLYFDYGVPFGRNSITKPGYINMPTCSETTIIISHTDKDHWNRLSDDIKAYLCDWYIPNQPRKASFNHKLSEILVAGGSVNTIDSDIVFACGFLSFKGISKIDPLRVAAHVHETGLSLRLDMFNMYGNRISVLIPGDQRYDYIDMKLLNDLDYLVASHHGGAYSWSTRDRVPTAGNSDSIIVYSYGLKNTHGHPSKVTDYRNANWGDEHHTCITGDFVICMKYYDVPYHFKNIYDVINSF